MKKLFIVFILLVTYFNGYAQIVIRPSSNEEVNKSGYTPADNEQAKDEYLLALENYDNKSYEESLEHLKQACRYLGGTNLRIEGLMAKCYYYKGSFIYAEPCFKHYFSYNYSKDKSVNEMMELSRKNKIEVDKFEKTNQLNHAKEAHDNDYPMFETLPRSFTPNNDGKNDVFKIENKKFKQLLGFQIFNSWGQLVFTTQDYNIGWDGTNKGVPLDMGAYTYSIKVETSEGKIRSFAGQVVLVR